MTPLISPALSAKDAERRASEGGDMTPLEILKQARQLISVPERWTQGENAKNDAGEDEVPTSPKATCWCAVGAILRTATNFYGEADEARRRLGVAMGDRITRFNDSHTHAEVLAAFDRAIAAAEGSR